jgi:malonyl-CoA/methylmalonyl-CoA synthetase
MTASPLIAGFLQAAAQCGDRIAVEDDLARLSYGALQARASSIAQGLAARGLAGARVGILARPGAPWVEAFLGVVMSGGTAVALSPLYPPGELRWFVEASGSRAIVVSDDLLDLATRVADSTPVLRVAEIGSETESDLPRPLARAEDVALVLFTSGTTGKPKGALLTHANVHSLGSVLGSAWRFGPDDVLLHVLPLHHLHGIGVSLLVALLSGATTRFLPSFDPVRVWEELGRASVLMGVPTQHRKLFDALDAADAETRERWAKNGQGLRLVTSGSAALSPSLGERWRALAGQYPLERYGMTEIGIVLSNPIDGERWPGTVGVPLPGVDLRLVGDDEDVRPGEPGEIWVRAPTVFARYDGNEDATRAAFTDGWFRTGDTAVRSEAGTVKILGRTSTDILKSGGYKISALEIEDVLREHDAVADVAIIGIPDETWGDLIVAVVVPRPGRAEDVREEALRAWAKERVAPYKVPKRVVLADDLPRNALGKVTKSELVRRMAASLG